MTSHNPKDVKPLSPRESNGIDVSHIRKIELNPLEVAHSLKQLIERFGLTQNDIARRTGKKRSTIANYLRLLSLTEAIQQSLRSKKLSMGHAKAILSVDGETMQEMLHHEILRHHLTVRQAEQRARNMTVVLSEMTDEALHLKDLEWRIQEKIGTRVELKGKGAKGQLTLHYYDLDELDRILEHLGIS